ncbi:MAG: hypothetical protein A3H35_00570 [Betaproteobacteria bacterium RIFCSPLOWO2_02_FULL_62_17]|nr:MAG: hypothetical protein A3H35_00570 [Betaproteobacteria bacterium RIFCSPLOWO2_02_FULL_62_17]
MKETRIVLRCAKCWPVAGAGPDYGGVGRVASTGAEAELFSSLIDKFSVLAHSPFARTLRVRNQTNIVKSFSSA